ncbi:MAG: hypothetical protein ABI592_02055 [Acidobacteriota bacterium]
MRLPRRPPLVVSSFLLAAGFGAAALAQDVKVAAGTVEDQRASDARMGGVTVELALSGSSLPEVKALRVRLKSAKDDLGASLLPPVSEGKVAEFEEFSTDRHPGPHFSLGSPARDATKITVSGDLELFMPSRDPATKQKFEKILSRLDKPLASPVLKAAKVEITPLSPAAYNAREKASRPTREQMMAEGKKHGASEEEIQAAIKMMDAISAIQGDAPDEKTVLVATKDPDGKIISVDLVAADGSELHAPSRGTTGGNEDKLIRIDFSEKPPADATLLVTLRTAKSILTIPINMKEVALP